MSNPLRLTGIRNVEQLLAIFWGITKAGNMQRRHGKNVAIPGLVKKCHVVGTVHKGLFIAVSQSCTYETSVYLYVPVDHLKALLAALSPGGQPDSL